MFYCQACGDQRGWPTDYAHNRSIGMCEMCQKRANCYDVPSSHLPEPPRLTPGQVAQNDELAAIRSIKQTIEKRSV